MVAGGGGWKGGPGLRAAADVATLTWHCCAGMAALRRSRGDSHDLHGPIWPQDHHVITPNSDQDEPSSSCTAAACCTASACTRGRGICTGQPVRPCQGVRDEPVATSSASIRAICTKLYTLAATGHGREKMPAPCLQLTGIPAAHVETLTWHCCSAWL